MQEGRKEGRKGKKWGKEGRKGREWGKEEREKREGVREGREGGRDGRRKHYGNIMVKLTLALLSDTHLSVVQKTRITFQHCVSGMPSSQMMPTANRGRKTPTQIPEHAHMPLQLSGSVPAHWPHPPQTHHTDCGRKSQATQLTVSLRRWTILLWKESCSCVISLS